MKISGKIFTPIKAKDLTYLVCLTNFLLILLNETKNINTGILVKS